MNNKIIIPGKKEPSILDIIDKKIRTLEGLINQHATIINEHSEAIDAIVKLVRSQQKWINQKEKE